MTNERPRFATLAEQIASRQAGGLAHPIVPVLGGIVMVATPRLAWALGLSPDAPWPSIIIASSIVGALVFAIGAFVLAIRIWSRRQGKPGNLSRINGNN